MINVILGQVFGFIATALTIISYQGKTQKVVLLFQTIATSCTVLSFFFLGATSGFALNIVCLLRNFYFFLVKPKTKLHLVGSIAFTVTMIVVGVISWQNLWSLLIIVALAVNTVFISLDNPQLLRKSVVATSTSVLIYNAVVFSLGGILNEGFSIISSIVGIIRYRKKQPD